jgi:creatinine amidohydrolase
MTSGPIPTIDDLATLGVQSLSPTGVLGDPTGATAAEGEQWLSAWVDDLANIIRDNS